MKHNYLPSRNNRNLLPTIPSRNSDILKIVDSFFNDFHGIFDEFSSNAIGKTNVSETETEYKVELLMPGADKTKINISTEDNLLTISYTDQKEETGNIHKEWSYSAFNRSFSLPENVDATNINAAYDNGILTLTIAKQKETPKVLNKIEVK